MTFRMPIATLLTILSASLAGCSAKPGDIVPGKPFVIVHNADVACVKERLLVRLGELGWKVISTGEGRLVAEQKAPPFLNDAARRTGHESPLVRMTLLGVQAGPNIEIIVDPYVVTNPGLPSEKVEPMEPTAEMQVAINSGGRDLEEYCKKK